MTASITTNTTTASTTWSAPKLLLHLEGLAILATAVTLYAQGGYSWWLFAALILAPDLAMLGYLINPRVGAISYNLFHNYAVVLLFLGLGYFSGSPWLLAIGLIWLAHAGMDRFAGYGLKYDDRFKHTHLDEL